jgi:hypothetical protein
MKTISDCLNKIDARFQYIKRKKGGLWTVSIYGEKQDGRPTKCIRETGYDLKEVLNEIIKYL